MVKYLEPVLSIVHQVYNIIFVLTNSFYNPYRFSFVRVSIFSRSMSHRIPNVVLLSGDGIRGRRHDIRVHIGIVLPVADYFLFAVLDELRRFLFTFRDTGNTRVAQSPRPKPRGRTGRKVAGHGTSASYRDYRVHGSPGKR